MRITERSGKPFPVSVAALVALSRLAGSAHPLDPDQSRRSTAAQKKWRMSFNPRRIFNIEVVAIAVIVFSVALICYVLLSLAGIIVEFPD